MQNTIHGGQRGCVLHLAIAHPWHLIVGVDWLWLMLLCANQLLPVDIRISVVPGRLGAPHCSATFGSLIGLYHRGLRTHPMLLRNPEPTLACLCLLADAGCTIHDPAKELHASCRWLNHGVHGTHVHRPLHLCMVVMMCSICQHTKQALRKGR